MQTLSFIYPKYIPIQIFKMFSEKDMNFDADLFLKKSF